MIKNISLVVGALLIADIIGFMLWILSGQTPVDNFYLGKITAIIIDILFIW